MSRRTWRLAAAGCGAAAFGLHLPVLTAHPDFDVVAVHDREPARAEAAARKFGIPAVVGSPGDLLRDADMLVVLTGGARLADRGRACRRTARVHREARQLRQQAQAAGLLLEVGAMRACDPALHALLAAVPAPAGGWLVKADGADAAARRRILPGGFAPYTFAGDPPPAVPAGLDRTQATALKTLLWEGYHLLTALALAVPAPAAATCAVDFADGAVHATAADASGHLYTIVIGRPPAGQFTEQVHLHGPDASATLDFPLPYTPGQSARLTTAGSTSGTFGDPFTCMWTEVSRHLAGEHPAASTAAIAEQVEHLALGLALTARPAPGEGACHA